MKLRFTRRKFDSGGPANQILRNAGAQDICATAQSSKPKESKATVSAARPTEAAHSQARP